MDLVLAYKELGRDAGAALHSVNIKKELNGFMAMSMLDEIIFQIAYYAITIYYLNHYLFHLTKMSQFLYFKTTLLTNWGLPRGEGRSRGCL